MGVKEERRKDAESGRIAELKKKGYICTLDDGKPYVFISYSSRNWNEALHEIVYNTCNKYGLRIYFDTNFDEGSDSWLTQFYDNMADENCKGVLAFFSPDYESSYACLMELMASQTGDVSKLVLPIVLGSAEMTSTENSGLGTLRFADNSLNNLWKKELELFNKFFNELVYDKANNAITDKEAALHSIYKNHSKEEPYKEKLNFQSLKGNDAYWKIKRIDSDEDKERHWNETLTKEDKNKSGEMYLSKKNCARLVNEIRSNLNKNDIDNVNKAVEDAIYNKLKDSGFASGANSVFDESLIGKLGTGTEPVGTEPPKPEPPKPEPPKPESPKSGYTVTITPDGKIRRITGRDNRYDAFYRIDGENYTILRGSRILVYEGPGLAKEKKQECHDNMNENNFLLKDISISSKSAAAKAITGNSDSGSKMPDEKEELILKEPVVVDLSSPLSPKQGGKGTKGKSEKPQRPVPTESLHKLFYDFIDKYNEQLQGANNAKSEEEKEKYKFGKGNWMYDMVCEDIPAKMEALHPLDTEMYEYDSSVGAGGWAKCPWIAVRNRYITYTMQQGVYVVYLLNPETKELYLTLNQGAAQFAKKALIEASAVKIRSEVETGSFSQELISTAQPAYNLGCICSKKYTLDNLPEDDVLVADLKEMLKIYDQYFELHKNEYPSVKKAPPKGKKSAAQLNTTDGTGVVDKGLF